jgi:hypothetical protein
VLTWQRNIFTITLHCHGFLLSSGNNTSEAAMPCYNGMLNSEPTKGSSMMNKQPFIVALMLVSTLLLFPVSGWSKYAPKGSAGVNMEKIRKQAEAGVAEVKRLSSAFVPKKEE